MHKIFTIFRRFLGRLASVDRTPDVLDRMTLRELADLPPDHPDAGAC